MAARLRVGDIVQLKSGGPKMTVIRTAWSRLAGTTPASHALGLRERRASAVPFCRTHWSRPLKRRRSDARPPPSWRSAREAASARVSGRRAKAQC
jgi:Uncharacterized small protein (DUF2158)